MLDHYSAKVQDEADIAVTEAVVSQSAGGFPEEMQRLKTRGYGNFAEMKNMFFGRLCISLLAHRRCLTGSDSAWQTDPRTSLIVPLLWM